MNTVDGSSAVGLSGGGAILAVSQASKAKVRIRCGVITPSVGSHAFVAFSDCARSPSLLSRRAMR